MSRDSWKRKDHDKFSSVLRRSSSRLPPLINWKREKSKVNAKRTATRSFSYFIQPPSRLRVWRPVITRDAVAKQIQSRGVRPRYLTLEPPPRSYLGKRMKLSFVHANAPKAETTKRHCSQAYFFFLRPPAPNSKKALPSPYRALFSYLSIFGWLKYFMTSTSCSVCARVLVLLQRFRTNTSFVVR